MKTIRTALIAVIGSLATAITVLAASSPAHATTVMQVDIPTMTASSEFVIRARVVGVRNVDLRAEGKALFTDIDFAVLDTYRGENTPAVLTMRMMGGVGADGTSMRIPGMPRFTVGEQVVVFLEATSLGHIPCGLGQGVWRVTTEGGGPAWVRQNSAHVHTVRRSAQGPLVEVAAPLFTPLKTLDELVAEIYAARQAMALPKPKQPMTVRP